MPNTYLGSTTPLNVEKKNRAVFTPDKGKPLEQGANQSTFELNRFECSHTHMQKYSQSAGGTRLRM